MRPTGYATASLLTLAALFAGAGPASAQVLAGRVLDAQSGAPVASAVLRLHDEEGDILSSARTDGDGAFRLQAPFEGIFRVTIEAIGYAREVAERVTLEGDATNVVLHASVEAVRLEAVTVSVEARTRVRHLEAAGFYDRMRYETGRFIERAEIEERNPRRITDLLRSIAGVRIVESGQSADIILRGGNMTRFGTRPSEVLCPPEIYVDGSLVSRGGSLGPTRQNLNQILPDRVEAIEVYASASRVPARFGGAHAMCGVVLFWTR